MFGTLQLGLGLTRGNGGGMPWYPHRLFQTGDILLWYDPSDLTTMFKDTAGTQPVTADGDSVALMLDKGQWGGKTLEQVLAAQPELVSNGTFDSDTAWTKTLGATIAAGVASLPSGGGQVAPSSALAVVAGRTYRVSYDVVSISGGGSTRASIGGTNSATSATTGTKTYYLTATTTGNLAIAHIAGTAGSAEVDNVSVKEIPGYHRAQATGTSMPKYKTDGTLHWLLYDGTDDGYATGTIPFNTVTSDGAARRNLLTEPDKFDHSTWLKLSGGTGVAPVVTANAGIAPDGTTTADRVVFDRGAGTTASDLSRLFQAYTSSNVCINTFYAKAYDGISSFDLQITNGSGIDVVTVTGEWQRFSVVSTNSTVNFQIRVAGDTTQQTADVLLWGAQGELGSTATDFQNIGTDEVAVCAGVTKSSDAAAGAFAEFSASSSSNNGSFASLAPSAAADNLFWRSKGTAAADNTPTGFAAPFTGVLTGTGKIASDTSTLRANGAVSATSATDQGTGNFGSYPLYFGRRGGVSAPFNGREYQTVIRSRLLSAAELSSLETFVAEKTGVIL